jgi:hypothetical protein
LGLPACHRSFPPGFSLFLRAIALKPFSPSTLSQRVAVLSSLNFAKIFHFLPYLASIASTKQSPSLGFHSWISYVSYLLILLPLNSICLATHKRDLLARFNRCGAAHVIFLIEHAVVVVVVAPIG